MRAHEFLNEGLSYPVICVDVQPEYSGVNDGDENPLFVDIIKFVCKQTGPCLMFVNAEKDGLTGDTIDGIKTYWEDTIVDEYNLDYEEHVLPIDWGRFTIVDKGYGYFRSWMDYGYISDAVIIKTIREMYNQKVYDTRMLFGGEDSQDYAEKFEKFIGPEFDRLMLEEPLNVNWTSVAQLKKFNGAYIVGGGRNECLREVELLMNAFNIKYKRLNNLVYGD
jgi:hypothetical protein